MIPLSRCTFHDPLSSTVTSKNTTLLTSLSEGRKILDRSATRHFFEDLMLADFKSPDFAAERVPW
jgi:hypothetical protein